MTTVYEYTFRRHKVAEVDFPAVTSPSQMAAILANTFEGAETERLVVVLLNTRNGVMGIETVYIGNVSAALVRVGELFRAAVRLNARSIILAHNHPSGDSTPSPDDLHLTAEAVAAGRLLDISVRDHIILADDGWCSLRDKGIAFER
jgi:DNA repair protein RadC